MEGMHQQKVNQMIKSAEGSAGPLHKITKPAAWTGGAQILKKEEEGARLLDRCEAKWKEWAKHWQCDESVQNMEDKPWNNEELKKLVEALPRLKECDLEKESRFYKAKDKSGMRRLPPERLLEFDERNMQRNCGVAGNGGTKWKMAAASLRNDVLFLIPNTVTCERPIALMLTLIPWWEALRAHEVAKWQQKYHVDWDGTDGRNGGAQ